MLKSHGNIVTLILDAVGIKNALFYSFALLIHKAKSFYCFHKQIIKPQVNYNPFNNYYPLEEELIGHAYYGVTQLEYLKYSSIT